MNTDNGNKESTERECTIMNSTEGSLTGYDCPKCKNKGVVYEPRFNEYHKYWYSVAVECECKPIRAEIRRRSKSGLNRLLEKYTFDSYYADNEWQKQIAKRACDFVRNPDGWFFIGGQVGCGKTHICTAIVNALIARGKAARYMIWAEEISRLKQFFTESEKYNTLMNALKQAEILYIDDFFKTKNPTASDIDNTFKIINHRYNEDLPTIISSELSVSQILRIDEALGSRIAEKAAGNVIYIAADNDKNMRNTQK